MKACAVTAHSSVCSLHVCLCLVCLRVTARTQSRMIVKNVVPLQATNIPNSHFHCGGRVARYAAMGGMAATLYFSAESAP